MNYIYHYNAVFSNETEQKEADGVITFKKINKVDDYEEIRAAIQREWCWIVDNPLAEIKSLSVLGEAKDD